MPAEQSNEILVGFDAKGRPYLLNPDAPGRAGGITPTAKRYIPADAPQVLSVEEARLIVAGRDRVLTGTEWAQLEGIVARLSSFVAEGSPDV